MFKIYSISHEICNIFKSKPCYETKKIYFYIPRFVHLFTKITVYSAARVATFTGIYQGSRLLSTQGQLRLSDVQANWCLIMIPDIINAGNGQAALDTVNSTVIVCSDIQEFLH